MIFNFFAWVEGKMNFKPQYTYVRKAAKYLNPALAHGKLYEHSEPLYFYYFSCTYAKHLHH